MNPLPALSVVLASMLVGYGIGRADRVSAEWMLAKGCRAIAWTRHLPDANGMIFINEGSAGFLCENGEIK
jgi:hypothetical protein